METILADRFKKTTNMIFAGTHLLIDIWEGQGLDEMDRVESALRNATKRSKATLMHIHLHRFQPSGGVSGVAILAESHISIHTWPERGYGAIDLFMCGDTFPKQAIPIFKAAFVTDNVTVQSIRRGKIK